MHKNYVTHFIFIPNVMFMDIIHRPVFYLKHTAFRKLDSVSVFRWNLLNWTQSVEFVPK
jgi:hypothetical protein